MAATSEPALSPPDLPGLSAPPHNLEAEMSVLGAILISDRTLYALVIEEGLKPEDFYRDRHKAIYQSMLDLYHENEPIDVVTVSDHLKQKGLLDEIGGRSSIDALAGAPPSVSGARRYAKIVREASLLRRLLTTTYSIQTEVGERRYEPRDLVERAEKAMLEVAHDDSQADFREIRVILNEELQKMQLLSQQGTALTGTPSGFKDLDEITGGFQPGHLIIIAARPSMGKSALVTNMAENAAIDHEKAVALFSLEMSETELAQRFVASQGRIFGDKLRKGRVPDSEWPRILEASQKLAKAPLFIDDSSDIGILDIRAKARRLHAQAPGGLGLIIVDYLQLMRPEAGTDNRVEQVGAMSRGLKILARELGVPVIALSQLSRAVEQRHDKKPILSDLRECVTGDTLVVLADGRRVPIRDLVGQTPEVIAVDDDDALVAARSDKVWSVGAREVFAIELASGRVLRATGEHRVRCGDGWRCVHQLTTRHDVLVADDPDVEAARGSSGVAVAQRALTRDRVVAVEPAGVQEVYDLTVPGPACWLADGIVSHNSGQIEQDADLVMFIYRDEYYNKEESEDQGLAEILIAKHRNGGLGDVTLTFRKEYPKFLNYAGDRYDS